MIDVKVFENMLQALCVYLIDSLQKSYIQFSLGIYSLNFAGAV